MERYFNTIIHTIVDLLIIGLIVLMTGCGYDNPIIRDGMSHCRAYFSSDTDAELLEAIAIRKASGVHFTNKYAYDLQRLVFETLCDDLSSLHHELELHRSELTREQISHYTYQMTNKSDMIKYMYRFERVDILAPVDNR